MLGGRHNCPSNFFLIVTWAILGGRHNRPSNFFLIDTWANVGGHHCWITTIIGAQPLLEHHHCWSTTIAGGWAGFAGFQHNRKLHVPKLAVVLSYDFRGGALHASASVLC